MKKHRWTTICKFLKWGLPSSVLFLFSLIGIGSSIATTHGMSSNRLPSQFSNPFDTPTPTAIVSPTATSTPTPTSTPVMSPTPILILTPISNPIPTPDPTSAPTVAPTQTKTPVPPLQFPLTGGAIFPVQTMTPQTPTVTTPTNTATSPSPIVVSTVTNKAIDTKTTLTNQQLPNLEEGEKVLTTFMLPLSVGAPLLLASGGMFWLIRRRQMNQYKPAPLGIFDDTQPALWVSSRELQALHYVTGASGALPVPAMSQTPYLPTSNTPLSLTQPTYTPSGLPSVSTSLRQSIPSISLNQPAKYPQDDLWSPLAMDSVPLPVHTIAARESNKYERVLTLTPIAPSMISSGTDVSSTSSPSWLQPVVSRLIQPPSTKNDPLLGEAMRQAQMGLFAMLGRK